MSHAPRRHQPVTFPLLLAGGAGTRLHELTRAECKPALPFGTSCRIVDFTMANAARSGLDRMLVATQYRPETLERHLMRRWAAEFPGGIALRNGYRVCRSALGYNGTAAAVALNRAEIDAAGTTELLVLSADHIYRMDYRAILARHRATGAVATVAAQEVPRMQASAFGVMQAAADGRILDFAEKPADPRPAPGRPDHALVSMGIYVFDWAWLRGALAAADPEAELDFARNILPRAVAQGGAFVHAPGAPAYWRDVGTLDSYREAQLDFAPGRVPPFQPLPAGRGKPPLRPEVPALGDSVLMPGARAMPGARLSRALVAPGAVVPAGLAVGEDPAEDSRWFRVTPGGTTLVTPAMLARRAADRGRLYAVPALADLRARIA